MTTTALLLILMITLSNSSIDPTADIGIYDTWIGPILDHDYTPENLGIHDYSSNGVDGSWGAAGLAVHILKYDHNVGGFGRNLLGINITGYVGIHDNLPSSPNGIGSEWYSIRWMKIEVFKLDYPSHQWLLIDRELISSYVLRPRYISTQIEAEEKWLDSISYTTGIAFAVAGLVCPEGVGAYVTVASMVSSTVFFIGKSYDKNDWRVESYFNVEDPVVITWDSPPGGPPGGFITRDGSGSIALYWWIKPGYDNYGIKVKLTVNFIKQRLVWLVGAVTLASQTISTECYLYLYQTDSGLPTILHSMNSTGTAGNFSINSVGVEVQEGTEG